MSATGFLSLEFYGFDTPGLPLLLELSLSRGHGFGTYIWLPRKTKIQSRSVGVTVCVLYTTGLFITLPKPEYDYNSMDYHSLADTRPLV